MQVYSVYMQTKHDSHLLKPTRRVGPGAKSTRQKDADMSTLKAKMRKDDQAKHLWDAVYQLWSQAKEQELLQLGLPVLRYASC